jgi:hypothetical protein
LYGIFGFIRMMSSLMALPLTFNSVFPWFTEVSHYGWGLTPILWTLMARMFISAVIQTVLQKGGADFNCLFFCPHVFLPLFQSLKTLSAFLLAFFFFPLQIKLL